MSQSSADPPTHKQHSPPSDSQCNQNSPLCLVLSKLDYCNSLLCGSPQFILDKLQRVQNSAARLVMKSRECDHVLPLSRNLHWLPVRPRIDYKISTLCFNTFTNSSPVYIAQPLSVYTPSSHFRSSSDTRTLRIPFIKTKSFGQRAFTLTGPT